MKKATARGRRVVLASLLGLTLTIGVLGGAATPAAAKQNGCATVYSSGYHKSLLGSTLGRVRAWAYWCDRGNRVTTWDSWGEHKEYQFWNFDSWTTYNEVSSGSTSSYKRSYYDAKFTGLGGRVKIFGVEINLQDSGHASRGLKAYASSGRAYGYG